MRYYAEWLDGEYVLLNQAVPGYDHFDTMERAIRFHALFGSTIVLSDVQMVDSKCPIPWLFHDKGFRTFLKERQDRKRDFLALVAVPAPGTKDEKLGVVLNGMKRMSDLKQMTSYEEAAAKLGELLLKDGSFDFEKHLRLGIRPRDQFGRLIKSFPQHARELKGLLHATDYFAGSPLQETTLPSTRASGSYVDILEKAQAVMNEPQANRIKNILEINDKLPKDQQGRRSAIRRILGDGPWQHEPWSDKNLGLYLDVVHAWNCANNLSVAPEAGSLYESDDGLPLSRFERSVTDTIGWFRGVPMPSTGLSERIRRFLRWNPRTKNWKWIAAIARETQNSAEVLQRTLKTGTAEEQQDALRVHAERIAGCLVGVGVSPVPEFAWSIAEAGVALWDKIPQESVGIAKEIVRATPLAIASAKRMRIVNTITNLGYGIL